MNELNLTCSFIVWFISGMSSLPPKEHLAAYDMLIACRKQIQETELCNAELCRMIESAPPPINYTDPDLLMLKVRKLCNG